jgi:threonine dehydrogenase-like Zn-dependent dehydrogenase
MPPVGNHVARCGSLPLVLRNITITGGAAPARAYIEELLPDVLDGRIEPGRVFDRTVSLDQVPDATAPWPTAKP